jgi:peptidoglycan/LPS O-acetylase OafA/YrhL
VTVNPALHRFMRQCLFGGWSGVDLFFVLSGFLVSGLLFREYQQRGTLAIGHFLARRGLKIYPGFWLLMLVTSIVAWYLRPGQITTGQWAAELLFVQNYFPGIWDHTWSLAVEEHFYLALALLLALLRYFQVQRRPDANPFRAIPVISVFVFLACLGFRVGRLVAQPEFNFRYHQAPSHLRMDSLMLGVLLSYWYHFDPGRLRWLVRWKYPLAIVGFAMVLLPFFVTREDNAWVQVIGFSIIAAGSGLLIGAGMSIELRPTRWVAALATVGAYSYSIYLWHYPIFRYGSEVIPKLTGWQPSWWVGDLVYVGASLAVGIAAAKLVEIPVLRWRDRILPSHSGTVPELAVPAATPVAVPNQAASARPRPSPSESR